MSVLENLFFVTSDCWSIAYISASYKLIHNLLRHFSNIQSSLLSKSFRQAKIFLESTFLSKSFSKQVFKTPLKDDLRARLLPLPLFPSDFATWKWWRRASRSTHNWMFSVWKQIRHHLLLLQKKKKTFFAYTHTHTRRSEPASLTRRSLRGCCWASTKENSIRQTQFSTQWMPSIIPVVPRGGAAFCHRAKPLIARPADPRARLTSRKNS